MEEFTEKDISDWSLTRLDTGLVVKCLNDAAEELSRISHNYYIVHIAHALFTVEEDIAEAAHNNTPRPWSNTHEIEELRKLVANFERKSGCVPPATDPARARYLAIMHSVVRRLLAALPATRQRFTFGKPGLLRLMRPLVLEADALPSMTFTVRPVLLLHGATDPNPSREPLRDFLPEDVADWGMPGLDRNLAVETLNLAAAHIRALSERPHLVRLIGAKWELFMDYEGHKWLDYMYEIEPEWVEFINVLESIVSEAEQPFLQPSVDNGTPLGLTHIIAINVVNDSLMIMARRHPPAIAEAEVLASAKHHFDSMLSAIFSHSNWTDHNDGGSFG